MPMTTVHLQMLFGELEGTTAQLVVESRRTVPILIVNRSAIDMVCSYKEAKHTIHILRHEVHDGVGEG